MTPNIQLPAELKPPPNWRTRYDAKLVAAVCAENRPRLLAAVSVVQAALATHSPEPKAAI